LGLFLPETIPPGFLFAEHIFPRLLPAGKRLLSFPPGKAAALLGLSKPKVLPGGFLSREAFFASPKQSMALRGLVPCRALGFIKRLLERKACCGKYFNCLTPYI